MDRSSDSCYLSPYYQIVHAKLINHKNKEGERREYNSKILQTITPKARHPPIISGQISVARALAVEPEFIICDESVSALDVSVQAQVLNLLKDLQEERGLTYIFISHDLSVVKFMSDMMAVMNDGKIVEFGPSENIYKDPHEDYTKGLISSIPDDAIEHVHQRLKQREAARRKRLSQPA